ncbi:diguanylate cyclase [Vibrio sp. JC009]|uniref:GGDEF domain-containing protein n=1 Tax=Vibrio sp. JC009 TaxID=2912314 RepID=UPI0023AEF3EE|nr:diguanylate cyclase [Vibrio sp. JC009]WED24121.1 diguanylate cyclase [Vibrio sp. JC009]
MENNEIKKMYEQSLHEKTLKLGYYLSILSILIFPLFYLKDLHMTKYSQDTLIWRALPIIFGFVFLALRNSKYRDNLKIIKYSYLTLVYSVLIMMLGVFYINYGELDGKFNSFLIAGLITTMLVIHIFSAPIRRYISLFTLSTIIFLPFLFTIKGGDLFIISNLLNPILIITSVWVIAVNSEKRSYIEFETKVLLEHNERTLMNEVEYRKDIEKQLIDEIVLDDMTGVYNRRAADRMIPEALEKHSSSNENFSLVFIDLDNLKKVNDHLGHDAGDLMIKNFAHIASSTLTKDDLIFRFGGDEFIIIFIYKSDDEVKEKMKLIREKCHDIDIAFSYGCSSLEDHNSSDIELMIKEADMQMYNYKKQRKEKYSNP